MMVHIPPYVSEIIEEYRKSDGRLPIQTTV